MKNPIRIKRLFKPLFYLISLGLTGCNKMTDTLRMNQPTHESPSRSNHSESPLGLQVFPNLPVGSPKSPLTESSHGPNKVIIKLIQEREEDIKKIRAAEDDKIKSLTSWRSLYGSMFSATISLIGNSAVGGIGGALLGAGVNHIAGHTVGNLTPWQTGALLMGSTAVMASVGLNSILANKNFQIRQDERIRIAKEDAQTSIETIKDSTGRKIKAVERGRGES